MPSPFEHEYLPPCLTNFSFENKGDQIIYQCIVEESVFDQPLIESIRLILADVESETRLPACQHVQEERDRYLKNWLEAQIQAVKMERLVKALDRKISLLMKNMREPVQGFFQTAGVSPVYKWDRTASDLMQQQTQEELHAEPKATLRVIKGGQE